MQTYRRVSAVLIVGVALGGCAETGSRQAAGFGIGAASGAAAGAAIAESTGGNPLVGAIIGGLAGGLVGGAIGSALDERERQQLMEASHVAAAQAQVGERIVWGGPSASSSPQSATETAASGWVVPTSEVYASTDGRNCRDLQQVALKEGKTYQQQVTACEAGGSWVVPA